MKKILLLGASSNVGYRFLEQYKKLYEIIPVNRSNIDHINHKIFTSNFYDNSIPELINDINPDYVVNCAAMGNVDSCEKEQKKANGINYLFVVKIVDILKTSSKSKLIHFSSNAIYDGLKPPYNENSVSNPLNFYGITKMKADEYIRKNINNSNFSILRPISIYGPVKHFQRNNPVNWMIQELKSKREIKLVNDVFANMIYIDDVAKSIHHLIEKKKFGEFNLSSFKILSLYEIGLIACKILKIPTNNIEGVCSDVFRKQGMALRPKNTSFNNSKSIKELEMNFIEIEEGIKKIIQND